LIVAYQLAADGNGLFGHFVVWIELLSSDQVDVELPLRQEYSVYALFSNQTPVPSMGIKSS
jgi:hypothetical protein